MTAFEGGNNPELASTMAETSAPARVTLAMGVATRLLDLLSSDDAFRGRFEANPRAALAEVGHETPAAHLGVFGLDPVLSFSFLDGGLASKESLANARELLLGRDNPAIFGPFDICAN